MMPHIHYLCPVYQKELRLYYAIEKKISALIVCLFFEQVLQCYDFIQLHNIYTQCNRSL